MSFDLRSPVATAPFHSLTLWQNSRKYLEPASPVPFLQPSPEHTPTVGFCCHYSSETALPEVTNKLPITKSNDHVSVLIFIYCLQHFKPLVSHLPETFSSFQDTCLTFLLLFHMLLFILLSFPLHLP